MERCELGKTGILVPELGFGAATLGGSYGPTTQAVADATVRAALDVGIDFFDTSPWYGNSEEVLGKALVGVPRDSYTLQTKLGRYPDGTFDFSPERVVASVDDSLRKLKTDCLDICLCHDIEFVPIQSVIDETLPKLRELQALGKIRFVGVSGLPLAIFRRVLAATDLDVILSYCHVSINDTSLSELTPLLREREVGVIGASPLSMGLLTENGPPEWHPAPPALKEAARRAAEFCKLRGASLPTLALAYARSLGLTDTLLVGLSSPEQVAENVDATLERIAPSLLEEVLSLFVSVQNESWPSGLPENAKA